MLLFETIGTYGRPHISLKGAILCITGYLAASLLSIRLQYSFSCDNQQCLRTLPDIWGQGAKLPWLRIIELDNSQDPIKNMLCK